MATQLKNHNNSRLKIGVTFISLLVFQTRTDAKNKNKTTSLARDNHIGDHLKYLSIHPVSRCGTWIAYCICNVYIAIVKIIFLRKKNACSNLKTNPWH